MTTTTTTTNLTSLTDADLQHMIDCHGDCDLMGNSWGKALEAEQFRRNTQRRMDNEIAGACVAALGDRGADVDIYADSAELFRPPPPKETTMTITNLDGATTHSEFMRTPGNGVARNSAFIQTWLNCEPAILYWAECDDMFLRFRFDPEAEISQMPIGVYFDAEAFIAAEETD